MSTLLRAKNYLLSDQESLSRGEKDELEALGLLASNGMVWPFQVPEYEPGFGKLAKEAISAPSVLNEAYDYGSSFSRGLRLDLSTYTLLLISGTASVAEDGSTVHAGDFRAQCWRTYRNITELLASEGASWHDVVKCTCYLRDIERDYADFNEIRTRFFRWQQLNPLPASVGIQARLCREDLLVEIEALAILKKEDEVRE